MDFNTHIEHLVLGGDLEGDVIKVTGAGGFLRPLARQEVEPGSSPCS